MLPSYSKILYATDLSHAATQALLHAGTIADRFDADITVMHILPDSLELLSEEAGMDLAEHFGEDAAHFIQAGERAQAVKAIRERIEKIMNEKFTHPHTGAHLANTSIKIVCGDPAKQITKEANKDGYDLIVMGTHGHGSLMDIVLGSVAKRTIKKSRIPVLVVPLPRYGE